MTPLEQSTKKREDALSEVRKLADVKEINCKSIDEAINELNKFSDVEVTSVHILVFAKLPNVICG